LFAVGHKNHLFVIKTTRHKNSPFEKAYNTKKYTAAYSSLRPAMIDENGILLSW